MKAELAKFMQQAQKMQENLQQAQAELGKLEVTGEAGGGMVKVTLNGRHEVQKVAIDRDAGDDLEMLEDLVAAAINDAVNRVREANQEKMASMTGGLPIPPGFNLP